MASAQVKIQDLKNGINACGVCTHELQLTAQQLQRDYMSAGSGWKDEQYKNLGQIVEDSCTAILQPIPQLDRKSTRLNSSHPLSSRMPSSA